MLTNSSMDLTLFFKNVNSFRHYKNCRFCFSANIQEVINLGYVPLAGGFIKKNRLSEQENFYPLTLSFCINCYLLQTNNVVDEDILFKNYFYHSSSIQTLVDHFKNTVDELLEQFKNHSNTLLIEIGCNDASLIKYALTKGFKAVGVDPATNIVQPLIRKGLPLINTYFTDLVANEIIKKHRKADIIFSSNTLAHIENMHPVFKGVKNLLKNDGIFIFETHYLGKLIKQYQYDMIYHEHHYYYSLLTLQKILNMYNLEVYDIQPIPIHAGSMRYYVQHRNGKQKVSRNVKELLILEKKEKLHKVETFLQYNNKIEHTKKTLVTLLKSLKKKNKTIAGYGASGRGTIMINYCELDNTYLDYVIDDAPTKQGNYTPGIHHKIVSSEVLTKKNRPDYVLLFAWSFKDEIIKRNMKYRELGGKFITPLPKVKIL